MSETQPPAPPATEAAKQQKPDEEKPLLWHYFQAKDKPSASKASTSRDILCLGCMNRMYDFRQEHGSLGQVYMTNAQYEEFVDETMKLYQGLVKQHKRVTVLTHPESLLAIVIRKPSISETDKLIHTQQDMTVGGAETEAVFRDDLVQRTLWPAQGSEQMAFLMEEAPAAFGFVLPQRLMELVGADRVAAKKVG